MTNARKWLPSHWMDEISPKSGDSPNDCLQRNNSTALPGRVQGKSDGFNQWHQLIEEAYK